MSTVRRSAGGFTIAEMMIALSVLAGILLLTAAVVTRFSTASRRATTAATTQTVARSIYGQFSEWLQYSSPTALNLSLPSPGGNSQGYCLGDVRVSYVLGRQYNGTNETHALVTDTETGIGCNNKALRLDSGSAVTIGQEHLVKGMRLSQLSITQLSPGLYKLTVKVVYGDDDLLNNPTGPDASCKTGAGSEYCAVVEFSTAVQSRL